MATTNAYKIILPYNKEVITDDYMKWIWENCYDIDMHDVRKAKKELSVNNPVSIWVNEDHFIKISIIGLVTYNMEVKA